ncbi:MAG: indole-3-glycerol-phosphate synthase, partial [Bacteroidota bacterium]
PCVKLSTYISDPKRSGIIAEFKRRSPSAGVLNEYADAGDVTLAYMQAGASGLSVLTDEYFFGARKDDLSHARKFNYCPILRKDFIVDEYQVIEAKSMGADAVLLIANLLTLKEIRSFSKMAVSLGMEVLLEAHSREDILEKAGEEASLIGINNRNLDSFKTDIENSIRLAGYLPAGVIKIAESGIKSADDIRTLKKNGFKGFLIGEYFMRSARPSEKCRELVKDLQNCQLNNE